MLNISKYLGLIALVCSIAGLSACGGGSGTDNKKETLLVCSGINVIKADGTCGKPDPLPDCPAGQFRPNPDDACIVSDFQPPTMPATVGANQVVVYLNKADAVKDFSGYSIYTYQNCGDDLGDVWLTPNNDDKGNDQWSNVALNPIKSTPETADPIYGGYFIIDLDPTSDASCGNFIIRNNGLAAKTADLKVQTTSTSPFNRRYFVIESSKGLVGAKTSDVPICINDVCLPYEKPALAISDVSAHWVNPSLIMWDQVVTGVELYVANPDSKITANLDGTVAGGTKVASLTPLASVDPSDLTRARNLSSLKGYSIHLDDDVDHTALKNLLKKELVIVGVAADGAKVGTRIQNYALLDALYTAGTADADEVRLGAVYEGADVFLRVWAPTAENVELRIFSEQRTPTIDGVEGYFPSIDTLKMDFDKKTGIWSYKGTREKLDRKYYRYRVTGYNYQTNSTNKLEVGDPNAVSLSADGYYSQIVDLKDDDLKPANWDSVPPELASFESMSIYETHVRDFSVLDQSTLAEHRGKYLAFTEEGSAPITHLKELVASGLTHIHLLPINDGSTIRESTGKKYNLESTVRELCNGVPSAPICAPGQKVNPFANNLSTLREVFESYAGDSDNARKLMNSLRGVDGFNWNYDPQFYNVPEGSYSSNADGITRIVEARAMNAALHKLGLRVVLDVVYPHMAAAGVKTANATFDKIVPGYYFRNDISGATVINDTGAGADTATEHAMMGKFLVDSVTQWAEQYKVDGFRFDQSGFIPKSVLVAAYNSVKAIDPDTYFYAEAWTASGTNASSRVAELSAQVPLAGTGIGTFNDRIRDPLRNLNLVNGGDLNAVRAGLAGNLEAFQLLSKSGKTITAKSVGAYNLDPQEAINYVEKHDGATLWDYMHLPNALPAGTTVAQRARIQALILSVPLLSQGVPFIQMGSELLRSKSMDSNSYNSGDWFNYVDFTKQTNNWRVGLPPEHSASDANILAAFADPQAKPAFENIQASSDLFNDFLKIGKSKLFSLTTAAEVLDRVGFHDGGTSQVNNVIVMSIDDGAGTTQGSDPKPRVDLDENFDAVVVVFNGTGSTVNRTIATSTGFSLHSVQQNSNDPVVKDAHFTEGASVQAGGTFSVPAYTTAVFVKVQHGTQGAGLLSTITSGYEPPVPYGDDNIYVRGGFATGWDASGSNQMAYKGKGIYSVYLNTTGAAANYGFLIGDVSGGFSKHKFGLGAITLGTPATLVRNGADLSISLPAGNYKFTLDATNAESPILTVTDANVYKATPFYARGDITTGGWTTNDAANLMVYLGNGIYDLVAPTQIDGKATATEFYEFKFGDTDWNPQLGSIGSEGKVVTLDTAKSLVASQGENLQINILAAAAGKYSIRLDVSDTAAPLAFVYKDDVYSATDVYVRGSLYGTDWVANAGNKLVYEGHGRYSKTLSVATNTAGHSFKIASSDWSTVNLGGTTTLVEGAPLTLESPGGDISLKVPATGNYKFTLDTASTPRTVTVTKVP